MAIVFNSCHMYEYWTSSFLQPLNMVFIASIVLWKLRHNLLATHAGNNGSQTIMLVSCIFFFLFILPTWGVPNRWEKVGIPKVDTSITTIMPLHVLHFIDEFSNSKVKRIIRDLWMGLKSFLLRCRCKLAKPFGESYGFVSFSLCMAFGTEISQAMVLH